MPLAPAPKGLRRLQLERLKWHIEQDAVLYQCFNSIQLVPTLAPENNPAFLPTLAIYVVRENIGFATTESNSKPGLFTMALLYPETGMQQAGIAASDIYLNMVDVVGLLLDKLYSIRGDQRDPAHNFRQLWHAMVFGGNQRAVKNGEIQVGPYAVGYEREAGVKQGAFISFALFTNQNNF